MTIRNALILAAALIGFSLLAIWAQKSGYISESTMERATQVAAGLVVVYFANLVPKTLEPLSGRCDPARVQATQRFSGAILLLGGLGYCLAWIAAPIELAPPLAMSILGTAVVVVMGRLLWLLRRRGGSPPARGPGAPVDSGAETS